MRDKIVAAALAAGGFVLLFIGYARPRQKIFDEVYFARAAEEYLRNLGIYESTHPPLSKLLITLSVMLFGGLAHGDNAQGWRFLDLLFGTIAVPLLYALARRVTKSTWFAAVAAGAFALDGMHFVQSRIATPESFAVVFSLACVYALARFLDDRRLRWLLAFGFALGCLVSTKWYGVMMFGVAGAVLYRSFLPRSPMRFVAGAGVVLASCLSVYALVWVPDLVRNSPDPGEIHSVRDVLVRQYQMFEYHYNLRATHRYSSKWWEWPLDDVPVAYFYVDGRDDRADPGACCLREITSMPNPAILWFGVFSVAWVVYLAWRERNRRYALVALAYVLQWAPWAFSPRIAWEYHYYVDVPLVCLCNAIVLQRFWQWGARHPDRGNAWMAGICVAAYALAVAGAFAYFYPILSARPITWNAWHARMWFPTWIIGPG